MDQKEWEVMTTFEREIHYNRNRTCKHVYHPPEDDRLRDAYSFDPYAHICHDDDCHTPQKFFAGTCECSMCVNNVGLERGSPYEYEKRKRRPIKRVS
jgi:hypothetical protein